MPKLISCFVCGFAYAKPAKRSIWRGYLDGMGRWTWIEATEGWLCPWCAHRIWTINGSIVCSPVEASS